MIKRTIEISQQPAHLAVRYEQLLIQLHDQPTVEHASIPCEDIGMVVVDHPQSTYSHQALATLAANNASLVVCDRSHLPAAVLLPLSSHSQIQWRINAQLGISKPLRKQLWSQLVRAKVRAQAANLVESAPSTQGKLLALTRSVRSGDPTNIEAQASRMYWSAWSPDSSFRRNTDGTDSLNSLLNYGYAIMRAAVARAIIAAGLLPMIALHHSNRSNNFALADDLMEPLRPIVDWRVRDLYERGRCKLDQPTKAGLLELLVLPVELDGDRGPLMVNLHRMIASLVKCYERESKNLAVPVLAAR